MSTHFDKSQFVFTDLDHDGQSERIHTFLNESGNADVVIRTNLASDQQRNYRGVYEDKTPRFIISEYDAAMRDENFLFWYENNPWDEIAGSVLRNLQQAQQTAYPPGDR